MKTIVYVDGFNLYYGSVKDTPHKWLNIHRMCELLLPNNQIVGIKYFTVKSSPVNAILKNIFASKYIFVP
jgi:hypothetical protein